MSNFDHRFKADSEEELRKLEEEVLNEALPDEEQTATVEEEVNDNQGEDEVDNVGSTPEKTEPEVELTEEAPQEEVVTQAPKPKPTPIPPTPEQSAEERLKHSTREALVLTAKNTKLVKSIDEAAAISDITDDELMREASSKGLDFEIMTDTERLLFKDSVLNSRKFSKVFEAAQEGRKLDEWADKVDGFIDDPNTIGKFSVISGREAEFRSFCMKETRRGVDLEDLAASFAFGVKPEVKRRGALLLTGSTGGVAQPKQAKLQAEDLAAIRASNPKKYRELVKSGRINEIDF